MSYWIFYSLFSLLLGSICCLVLWYYFYIVKPFSKLPSFRIDARLLQIFFSKEKFTTYITHMILSESKKFQSEGLLVLWFFKPYLCLYNEEDIKNVINNNINKSKEYNIMNDALGVGLFHSDEILWRKRRKMLNPAFKTKALKEKIPIFNKYSMRLVQELGADSITFVDVEKLLKKFSFYIINEAISGISRDDSLSTPEEEIFVDLIDKIAEFVTSRLTEPWLYFMNLFQGVETRYQEYVAKSNEFARQQVVKMKNSISVRKSTEEKDENSTESTSESKSFAEILLEHHAKDPDFTVNDMLIEIKFFHIAGYDTISGALNWCLFLLGNHPGVQDHVYEEIKSLKEDLSFEDLQDLTYMECVIMETLRLYPPAPAFGRQLKNETKCGKYRIPKGTSVIILAYLHHRNPKVFSDPDKFDPDRFLGGNSEKQQWKNLAFSTGIRNCLGQKFAMMEIKIALAHILRKFKIISYEAPDDSKLIWAILLKSEQPLLMRFIPREISIS